jgi:hypothetical protein
MVSSVFGQTPEQLMQRLKVVAAKGVFDPEYQELRADMPSDFPI